MGAGVSPRARRARCGSGHRRGVAPLGRAGGDPAGLVVGIAPPGSARSGAVSWVEASIPRTSERPGRCSTSWPKSARSTNCWLSNLLKGNAYRFRACISAQPRGIANLAFVGDSAKPLIHEKKRSGYRMGQVNSRGESRASERDFEPTARAQGAQPIHEKRPSSWASAGRSADRETVRIGRVAGGRGTVVKSSLLYISMS